MVHTYHKFSQQCWYGGGTPQPDLSLQHWISEDGRCDGHRTFGHTAAKDLGASLQFCEAEATGTGAGGGAGRQLAPGTRRRKPSGRFLFGLATPTFGSQALRASEPTQQRSRELGKESPTTLRHVRACDDDVDGGASGSNNTAAPHPAQCENPMSDARDLRRLAATVRSS